VFASTHSILAEQAKKLALRVKRDITRMPHETLHRNRHVVASQRAAASAGFYKTNALDVRVCPGWCHHNQMSHVFTRKNRTYQVCFECGREFEYSWAQMHVQQPNAADYVFAPLYGGPAQVAGILIARATSLNP
jgi:hypothetical protein